MSTSQLLSLLAIVTVLVLLVSVEAKEETYYEILGLKKNAKPQDIKRAYRKQAMKWHPDKNPTNKEAAEERFKQISEAYQVLSDPERRKQYDMFGKAGPNQGMPGGGGTHTFTTTTNGFGGIDPRDLFKDFFKDEGPNFFQSFFGGDGQAGFQFSFGGGDAEFGAPGKKKGGKGMGGPFGKKGGRFGAAGGPQFGFNTGGQNPFAGGAAKAKPQQQQQQQKKGGFNPFGAFGNGPQMQKPGQAKPKQSTKGNSKHAGGAKQEQQTAGKKQTNTGKSAGGFKTKGKANNAKPKAR